MYIDGVVALRPSDDAQKSALIFGMACMFFVMIIFLCFLRSSLKREYASLTDPYKRKRKSERQIRRDEKKKARSTSSKLKRHAPGRLTISPIAFMVDSSSRQKSQKK